MIVLYDGEKVLGAIHKPYPPTMVSQLKAAGSSYFMAPKQPIKHRYVEISPSGNRRLANKKKPQATIDSTTVNVNDTITIRKILPDTKIVVEGISIEGEESFIFMSISALHSFSLPRAGRYNIIIDAPRTEQQVLSVQVLNEE